MKHTAAALFVSVFALSAVPAVASEYPAAPAAASAESQPAVHRAVGHHWYRRGAGKREERPAISEDKLPASTQSYLRDSEKMHREMAIDYSGNADEDFVRNMIPHHKGAVAMAETELKYGKDPEIRAMAQQIIATQKAEVKNMEAWEKAQRQAAKGQSKASGK